LKVSIITVVLNNRLFIKDAIESVINQQHVNLEYIVIDGGSTDGSIDIINSYKNNINTIISESDDGIYDAMNKGLKLATGDIIGFLNADDFYANTTVLHQVVNSFASNSIEALYADLDYVSSMNKDKVIRKWRSGAYNKHKFTLGWMPPHPTFFVKKSVYQNFGGFNQKLRMAADYEIMLRFLYVNNVTVFYLKQVIVKMRLGGQSNRNFKNRILANIDDRNAWLINGITPKWYTLLLKPLSKIAQYFTITIQNSE
jgi:glycosyltransferase involved in cell wall biosynthesis